MAGCRVVRRTKKPTGSRAGCLRALRGGRFEWRGGHPTPGTKKGFCIPVFVILGKRWCVGKKSTFSLVYSQIILINAKTPHFRAVFLLCIFFINTFWRRWRDSNSRAGFEPTYRISSADPSTAWVHLQIYVISLVPTRRPIQPVEIRKNNRIEQATLFNLNSAGTRMVPRVSAV